MTIRSEVVEVMSHWTDKLTTLSLGFPASSSVVESCACAQLSALKKYHSTCQHLSPPNTSSPLCFYSISEVQSNFYINSYKGETPERMSVSGTLPLPNHPSPSGKRCHLIVLPSLPSSSSSFHLSLALTWTLMRTRSCQISADVASFLPRCHKAVTS